ncbi:MAG: hypothetical protein ABIG44_14980 [Planctomycetota bacterium]
MLVFTWNQWLAESWQDLVAGKMVAVPGYLPHPAYSGFQEPPIAEPMGQSKDWVQSLNDGSRLHVHEYANGERVAHRDRWDPSTGAIPALKHFLLETKAGQVMGMAGLGLLLLVASKA